MPAELLRSRQSKKGVIITYKEQNAQYRNTWDICDKTDGVNLPHKTAKEDLEHGRDITKMMCELQRQQATPELEIDLFDGNSMDFDYLWAAFKEVVANKVTDLVEGCFA